MAAPGVKPLFLLRVNDDWRERFAEEIIDDGGWPGLERILQAAWIRERRMLIPVDDYEVYRRIKQYAYETSGGWQTRFRFLSEQMPDDLPDPQGSLFT